MISPLGVPDVEALAPDASSLQAGRRLGSPAAWSGCGHDERAVWGSCKGTAARPYQVAVDTRGPAYRCDCPSRKLPCKHALGLLLRWARGDPGIPAGSAPPEVAGWLAGRVARVPSGELTDSNQAKAIAPPDATAAVPGAVVPGADVPGAVVPGAAVPGAAVEHPGSAVGDVPGESSGEAPRAGAPAGGPPAPGTDGATPPHPRDRAAAAARSARREARIVAGMSELERWLDDLVRGGIGQLQGRSYAFFDAMGARLVDAQAPGAAASVREIASLVRSGEGWPSRVLERLASLHLLARGWQRAGLLSPEVRADLRAAAGWPEQTADVLADPGRRERGEWYVLARSVTEEERVRAQRTWLWELASGRLGVLVDFARPGAAFAWDLWPGNVLSAEMARYPGSSALRVLVAEQLAEPRPGGEPPAWPTLGAAAAARAAVLASDPWLARWPLSLSGAVAEGVPGRWALRDAEGSCVQMDTDDATGWIVLATCGGRAATVLGEWEGRTLRPLGVWTVDGRMVVL
jgi:hypothetical protein